VHPEHSGRNMFLYFGALHLKNVILTLNATNSDSRNAALPLYSFKC
jgi:hypothetical protein